MYEEKCGVKDEKTLNYLRAIYQTLNIDYITEFQKQYPEVPEEFRIFSNENDSEKDCVSRLMRCKSRNIICSDVCTYCNLGCVCDLCAKQVKSICNLCENTYATSKISCGCTDDENPCVCRRCLKNMDPVTKITKWIEWW